MERSSSDVKWIIVPLMTKLSGQSGVPDQVQNGHMLYTITCMFGSGLLGFHNVNNNNDDGDNK
jgi:hypothetical protein